MEIDLLLKNYRCFQRPARISLRRGFTGLIGINNSGKSSLLKSFYEFRNLFGILYPNGNMLQALLGNAQGFAPIGTADNEELFCNVNERNLEIEFEFRGDFNANQLCPKRFVITIGRRTMGFTIKIFNKHGEIIIQPNDNLDFSGEILRQNGTPIAALSHLFNAVRPLVNALYLGPFRNIINVGTNSNYFDIHTGEQFVKTWKSFKTGSSKKNNEAIYKLTRDIGRIFEYQSLEINPAEGEQTLQIFINGKSYRLSELGAGIAQFILVLANAAIKNPPYLLIDEPELNLHPTLQLDFLTTLASYASEGIYFATHNIGLARASADRIYSVRKISEGNAEITPYESTPHLSEFLGELSYAGYRELGYDQVLLVEGPTEVKVIQQFLRLYKKAHKVVIIHLGGDSSINGNADADLEELAKLSNKVKALIDSERTTADAPLPNNRQQFLELCEARHIPCQVLTRRATENYFTDRAIKTALGSEYEQLGEYQRLKDANLKWNKRDNWRIAREMTLNDLQGTDLNAFLESL